MSATFFIQRLQRFFFIFISTFITSMGVRVSSSWLATPKLFPPVDDHTVPDILQLIGIQFVHYQSVADPEFSNGGMQCCFPLTFRG